MDDSLTSWFGNTTIWWNLGSRLPTPLAHDTTEHEQEQQRQQQQQQQQQEDKEEEEEEEEEKEEEEEQYTNTNTPDTVQWPSAIL